MSFLAAVGGAALSSLFGSGSSVMNGAATSWATNSARESLNKNITKTNLKYQKEYDLWTQQQDMRYNKEWEQWFQNYMYDLQNNEYYKLAQKYATNTASWAVQGLRRAGLNPILAAIDSNLSSSMGNASPMSSPSGRHSKGGVPSGSAPSAASAHAANLSMLQDLQNSAKQGELLEGQKDVQSAQANNLNAQASLANTQAANAKASEGMTGTIGAVFNIANKLGLKDDLQKVAKTALGWLKRKMTGEGSEPNTAQTALSGLSDFKLHELMSRPDTRSDKEKHDDEVKNARLRLQFEKERLRDMPFKGKMSPIWSR